MHVTLLILVILIGVLSHTYKIPRKSTVVMLGLVLFLFSALRGPSVGIDVPAAFAYYRVDAELSYREILKLGSGYLQSSEPIFHLFLHTLSLINTDPQFMLVIIGAFFAISFSYFVYHQEGSPLLMYLLLITLRIFAFTLTGLRQTMAISFLLFALVFLQKKKILLYILFTIIASFFHNSAIVFIFAYLLVRIRSMIFLIASMFILTAIDLIFNHIIITIVNNVLLRGKYAGYIDRANTSVFSFTVYILLIIFTISIFFHKEISKKYSSFYENIRIASFGIVALIIGIGFPNLFRISYYYIVTLFPIFSQLINVKFVKFERFFVIALVVILLSTQYIVLRPGAGINDYVFFWQS